MGYLQIELASTSWMLKIDGKRVHGVLCESREDLIYWALWKSRGRIPDEFVAPLALQSIAESIRRVQSCAAKGGAA